MNKPFRSLRLDPSIHDVTNFHCGEEQLDQWLQEQAVPATKRHTARTWVLVNNDDMVVGYYALTAHKVVRAKVPNKIGRGGPQEIPAVLIARLARSEQYKGQGIGQLLLADAFQRIISATRIVAARLVVVDAMTEKAARFYEEFGFSRIPESLMLVQKVSDIEKAYDQL